MNRITDDQIQSSIRLYRIRIKFYFPNNFFNYKVIFYLELKAKVFIYSLNFRFRFISSINITYLLRLQSKILK